LPYKYAKSGVVAELVNVSVVCPRNPVLKLGVDNIFSDSVCIKSEFKIVGT
jgi:hypothetical protein